MAFDPPQTNAKFKSNFAPLWNCFSTSHVLILTVPPSPSPPQQLRLSLQMTLQILTNLIFPLTCFFAEMEQIHISSADSDNNSGIEVSTNSHGSILANAGDAPFLITTSALEAGADYPSLRRVIHVDAPEGLVAYCQLETARERTVQSSYHLISQSAEIVATVPIRSPRTWSKWRSFYRPATAFVNCWLAT